MVDGARHHAVPRAISHPVSTRPGWLTVPTRAICRRLWLRLVKAGAWWAVLANGTLLSVPSDLHHESRRLHEACAPLAC